MAGMGASRAAAARTRIGIYPAISIRVIDGQPIRYIFCTEVKKERDKRMRLKHTRNRSRTLLCIDMHTRKPTIAVSQSQSQQSRLSLPPTISTPHIYHNMSIKLEGTGSQTSNSSTSRNAVGTLEVFLLRDPVCLCLVKPQADRVILQQALPPSSPRTCTTSSRRYANSPTILIYNSRVHANNSG